MVKLELIIKLQQELLKPVDAGKGGEQVVLESENIVLNIFEELEPKLPLN